MSLLYKEELLEAPYLCFGCAAINSRPDSGSLKCPECNFEISQKRYEDFYRYAFYAARYGIQYRRLYDRDEPPSFRPSFESLGELGAFVAIAAVSGIIGNATWEGVKNAISRIMDQREKCKNANRSKYEKEDIEKLIQYIIDYDGGFKAIPEKIQKDLIEEIIGDAAAENMVIARRLLDLTVMEGDRTPEQKRQAMVLYRELARRSVARSARRPSRAAGKFWSRANG